MFVAPTTHQFQEISTPISMTRPTPAIPSNVTDSGSHYQSSSNTVAGEAKSRISQIRDQIARQIAQPDMQTMEKLQVLNQKRATQGQNPIDLKKTTADLEAIYEDRSLNVKEKKSKIEHLRKTLRLSKGEMKSLFTKRLEKIYKNAQKSLATFQKAKTRQLQDELKQAEAIHGKNSPQAQAVQSKRNALQRTLKPEQQRLAECANFYGSLYPGFWSKVGSFFKKLGQGFGKGLSVLGSALRFLPGIGPIASKIVSSAKYLLQGKVGKMLGELGRGIWEGIKNYKQWLPLIPGVGSIAGFAVTGIEAVLRATRGGSR